MKVKSFFVGIALFAIYTSVFAQPRRYNISNDGTWCWFSDPRAIYLPKNGSLITGCVKEDGSIASILYYPGTGFIQQSLLARKLEVDDHNNPSFLQTNDSTVLAFYTKHHNSDLYMQKALIKNGMMAWGDADTINPNGKADLMRFGDNKYTYANPFMLSSENNRIYLFGRWIGFKPNITWSDDQGKTWVDSKVMIAQKPFNRDQRPYVKYFSDGKDKIHMVFTDGHPRDEATNNIYYAYYSKGAFYRAGGDLICTVDQLPFEPRDASIVYDAKKTRDRAWVFDIVADADGNPAIAYARYPSTKEHIYHYAYFNGVTWNDQMIVNSGKWFPQTPAGKTEREPHYSGGMSLDPNNKHTIYISRELVSVFEIEQWIFQPEKGDWVHYPITKDSRSNQVRPFVIRNVPADKGTFVLWNSIDRYVHYTDFLTQIKMAIVK